MPVEIGEKIMKYLVRWMVCVTVMLLAAGLFPAGVVCTGGVVTLIVAGSVLWLLNLLLRPLLQVIAIPLTIVTLGIFSLFVNAAMVCLTDTLLPGLSIRHFWICLVIAAVVSLGNMATATRREDDRR